ncbi:MAG: hypothetical protein MUE68_05055 [Bacteroidetes bacterium]|jgi:hypothetical protein|nr:hypothetical protein [Bacteroidota bacterium]
MRTTRLLIALLAAAFVAPPNAVAQYNSERVMEKSFEQSDFFFMPYRFIPYGIGAFRNTVSGMLDDPFLALDVNPARTYRDSSGSGYFMADFRNARTMTDLQDPYYPYPMLRTAAMTSDYILPFPRYYVQTRRELEPAVSLGYLMRPLPETWSALSLGATYQLITQDEDYYAIPQDVYRSVMGADYNGVRAAGTENIPIVDMYRGANEMHQEGHYVSAFAGLELTDRLEVGAKIGRVVFEREGSYGSNNLWDNGSATYVSYWQNWEEREQSYGHWEGSLGLRYALTGTTSLGLTASRLEGSVDQTLPRNDSSFYSYGPVDDPSGSWGINHSSGIQDMSWKHDGNTTVLGVDLSASLTPARRVELQYAFTRQDVDITLRGDIRDASIGRSRWSWDTTVYRYQSSYGLTDIRSGGGTVTASSHRLSASYHWKLGESVTLSLGGQIEVLDRETNTSESVTAVRWSRYQSTGSYAYAYFDSTAEVKDLRWNFTTSMRRLTIPFFLTYKASEAVELLLGLNRTASTWEAEEVTLAVFERRLTVDQNGTTTRTMFGERYTQPRERSSEVRTSLMAGLVVSPTPSLSIRFIGVPNCVDTYHGTELSDIQLWLSLTVRP